MKTFWKWIGKNLSNIFGLIGILVTVYLGVFYVPGWLKQSQQEKVLNAQRNLQQLVKELIYSDSVCTFSEISILIKAKEIELNQSYPLSAEDLLTQVEESFMQDRFLPLEKRKALVSEIELIKKQIPKQLKNQILKTENKTKVVLFEWLSVILSILGGILALISFYSKFKTEKAKDEEIENQIITTENSSPNVDFAYDFEKQITNIIGNYPGVKIKQSSKENDFGFDLEFEFKQKPYFVEVKYLMVSKVGLSSFNRFLHNQKGLEGEFWFVYNTELTEMVKQRAEEMIKLFSPGRKIILIKADDINNFKKQLLNLLPTVE